MIDGIIAFLYQIKQTKRQKQMSLIERIKQSLKWTHLRSVRIEEVEPGSVRVLHKIVHRLSFFLSLPMPCNPIHYSSTTWTITFVGCRIDVFDLMFCWCHSFFVFFYRIFSWLSPVFVNVRKHWIVDNDRLINTDNNGIKVWYIQRIRQSIDQSIKCLFPVS